MNELKKIKTGEDIKLDMAGYTLITIDSMEEKELN